MKRYGSMPKEQRPRSVEEGTNVTRSLISERTLEAFSDLAPNLPSALVGARCAVP